MVRGRKDSSSEIYVGLIRMVSITITSNITLVLPPQLALYMAQQYRQGSRVMKNLYRGVERLSRNQTSAFLGRENHLGHKNVLWRSTELLTSYARAWEICCPNMWPHNSKSKSHRWRKRFVYLRRREEPLRPPVYWPCIISVHQESWLQRWTLLRTVLWMGKIKGIIWVRCVETSMLHLTVSIKGVTKINPPPPTTTTTMVIRDEVRGEAIR